jgi:site-specific DNA-cytosine methylase
VEKVIPYHNYKFLVFRTVDLHIHQEEIRAISLREGAVCNLSQWNIFKATSIAIIAKMIGNAVPPKYSECRGML